MERNNLPRVEKNIFIIGMLYCVVNVGQSPLSQMELSGQALIYPALRAVEGSDLPHHPTRGWLAGPWRDQGATSSPDHGMELPETGRGAWATSMSYSKGRVLSPTALPKMFAEAQTALWPAGWLSPQQLFTGDHWGFQIPRGFYALFSGFSVFFCW